MMDGGMMNSMMGWMMGLGLLGWVLVIALLVAILITLVRLLNERKSRGGQPSAGATKNGSEAP